MSFLGMMEVTSQEEDVPLLGLEMVKDGEEPRIVWKATAWKRQERDPLLNPWGNGRSADIARV